MNAMGFEFSSGLNEKSGRHEGGRQKSGLTYLVSEIA